VEIIRAPDSVLYGTKAFTGVVSLKSRAIPEQTTFSWSGMVGSEGYYDTTVSDGGLYGDLGIISDVRVADQQGYKYTLIFGTGTYGSDYDTNKNISTMNHIEMARLTLDVFYSNLETFYMIVIPSWNYSDNIMRTNKLSGNLGYTLHLHERIDVQFNLT
jgi:outer membrane receptor for ferrienterochelin and colicins